MPIPDYQSIMLPLLRFASDGKEHSLHALQGHRAKKGVFITTSTYFIES